MISQGVAMSRAVLIVWRRKELVAILCELLLEVLAISFNFCRPIFCGHCVELMMMIIVCGDCLWIKFCTIKFRFICVHSSFYVAWGTELLLYYPVISSHGWWDLCSRGLWALHLAWYIIVPWNGCIQLQYLFIGSDQRAACIFIDEIW